MTPGQAVTILPHKVWNPSWGFHEAPGSGQRGTVVSVSPPFAAVKLHGGVILRTELQNLEPKP